MILPILTQLDLAIIGVTILFNPVVGNNIYENSKGALTVKQIDKFQTEKPELTNIVKAT